MTPGGFRPRKSGLIFGFRRRLRSLRKNWLLAFLIDLVAIVGFALILSVLIKAFLIRSFFIPSGSMLDTLQINDRIIVNVLAPEVVELQHGDVVVFKDPGGWLGVASAVEKEPLEQLGDFVLGTFGITAPDSAEHLVKRVIGLPGDVITCCDADGKLLLNGLPLDEPYLRAGSNPSDIEFSVTVPAGQLWVMGDNRGPLYLDFISLQPVRGVQTGRWHRTLRCSQSEASKRDVGTEHFDQKKKKENKKHFILLLR